MKPRVLSAVVALVLLGSACGGGQSSSSDYAGTTGNAPTVAAPAVPAPANTGERDATDQQMSTFALDVDTASYGYARRAIQEGRWPEPGQVRIEEFVNAFRQDYAEPDDDGFAVHVDGARSDDAALVRV